MASFFITILPKFTFLFSHNIRKRLPLLLLNLFRSHLLARLNLPLSKWTHKHLNLITENDLWFISTQKLKTTVSSPVGSRVYSILPIFLALAMTWIHQVEGCSVVSYERLASLFTYETGLFITLSIKPSINDLTLEEIAQNTRALKRR